MRKRIIRLTSAVTLAAILLFGVPLAFGLTRFFLVDQHRQLLDQARSVAVSVSGDAGLRQLPAFADNDPATRFTVYDTAGSAISGSTAQATPQSAGASAMVGTALKGQLATGTAQGGYAVAVPVSDGNTVVGAVLGTVADGPVFTRIGITWASMLALAALALALTWLLGRRQADKLTQPLKTLAAAAERLGGGDFTVHTSPVGIAEIDSVNRSINRTATRLQALLERERAYTADASHQLRTPLTGLRLQLEAALEAPGPDPRGAIKAALRTADRLEQTITDLLALARDPSRASDILDIPSLSATIHDRWHAPLATKGRPLRITAAGGLPNAAAAPAAVTQIVDVLVDNALRHGRGAVYVTFRSGIDSLAIDVSNEGPRITEAGAELFQRRGTGGHGIGLAMAARLAAGQGGRLMLTAATPTFTAYFPGVVGSESIEPEMLASGRGR